jgi:hypothetical protein
MLQVATFLLPDQQDAANEFLKTHRPEGPINFNKDTIVVFWDNGDFPPEYQLADLQELLKSVRAAKLQQDVALYVMKSDLADLNPTHNKGEYEQLSSVIHQTEDAIAKQDIKAAFLEERIKALAVG